MMDKVLVTYYLNKRLIGQNVLFILYDFVILLILQISVSVDL